MKTPVIYLTALITSTVIAWGIGALLLSSPTLLEKDRKLNLAVPIENSTTRFVLKAIPIQRTESTV